MDRRLYIITGTSRGLGKAIVDVILPLSSAEIVSIGRTLNDEHARHVNVEPGGLHFIEADLAQPELLIKKLEANSGRLANADQIIFINNAGTISPIEKIGSINERELMVSLHVNSASPAIIVNHILKVAPNKKLIFVNVTSGAAVRAIGGWAAYCAGKAYAKMFFSVLAEQVKDNPSIKVFQIDPGMLDTEMQQEIRGSKPDAFPKLEDFVAVKEKGNLKTAREAAIHIIDEIGRI